MKRAVAAAFALCLALTAGVPSAVLAASASFLSAVRGEDCVAVTARWSDPAERGAVAVYDADGRMLGMALAAEDGATVPCDPQEAKTAAVFSLDGDFRPVAPALRAEVTEAQPEKSLSVSIDGRKVAVSWEENESVAALRRLTAEGPLTINMSMYGGFEQVGALGTSLPRNDAQTTTSAGDIVLYSGSRIVVFYGSNSWAYTRLGRITGLDAQELRTLLGSGNVTLTLSME